MAHLESYQHYYAQQFLSYVTEKTKNKAVVDFVNQIVDASTAPDLTRSLFDVERAFIDRQYIVVPATITLAEKDITQLSKVISPGAGPQNQFSLSDIAPAVDAIEVPCDGIHLEVAAGICVLQNLPPTTASVELNVQGASLKATGA